MGADTASFSTVHDTTEQQSQGEAANGPRRIGDPDTRPLPKRKVTGGAVPPAANNVPPPRVGALSPLNPRARGQMLPPLVPLASGSGTTPVARRRVLR